MSARVTARDALGAVAEGAVAEGAVADGLEPGVLVPVAIASDVEEEPVTEALRLAVLWGPAQPHEGASRDGRQHCPATGCHPFPLFEDPRRDTPLREPYAAEAT